MSRPWLLMVKAGVGGEDAADQGLADQQAVADVVPLLPNDHVDVEAEGAVDQQPSSSRDVLGADQCHDYAVHSSWA